MIAGYGGYVPLYRIQRDNFANQDGGRAQGESAVPARDENHITMAVEAADVALDRAGVGEDLDAVYAASVTDPFAEHGIAAHVAYRLGATGDVRTGDYGGGVRAATDALFAAKNFVTATDGTALVVGTDIVPVDRGGKEESTAGAGAGAVALTPDGGAATLRETGQATTGFVERHRRHGDPPTPGDPKFEAQHGARPAVDAAVERALESTDTSCDRAIIGVANRRFASAALEALPVADVESTFDAVGYAGAATFYLDLADLLERTDADETILAVCYGTGGADTVVLDVGDGDDAPDAGLSIAEQLESKEYVSYAAHIAHREPVEYEGVTVS